MEEYILTSKKSQAWGLDLMIAVVIFIVGIIAIYVYAINFTSDSSSILESLFSEGNLLSSLVLSEGTPKDWNLNLVEIPGILSSNKINQTKLDSLYSLSQTEYEKTKRLLGTSYNFYFTFLGIEAGGVSILGIGKYPEAEENLVRVERFSIYKNKPVKIEFYIWN